MLGSCRLMKRRILRYLRMLKARSRKKCTILRTQGMSPRVKAVKRRYTANGSHFASLKTRDTRIHVGVIAGTTNSAA